MHAEPKSIENMRFLEVGVERLFKRSYPAQTDFFYTGTRHHSVYGPDSHALTPRSLLNIAQRLRKRHYDLVVVHPPLYSAWQPRSFFNVFKYRPLTFTAGHFSTFAYNFLRLVRNTPMVVVDEADSFGVCSHNFFLFDRCHTFFKRELPADNWLVFYATGHRNLPGRSFRHKKRFQRYVTKLRPLSIGTSDSLADVARTLPPQKTTDVFFAGETHNSSVRAKGIEQLLALREQGVRVDIPDTKLPFDEFLRRCAAAWLVWSPSGFGWDCFRHYEVALTGSVPLMNMPTIERHQPYEHGKHCLFYSIEGDNLSQTILTALQDKPRLQQMANAARQHALAHHTHSALCRHVVSTVFPAYQQQQPIALRRAS